ncbi:MAG: acyl-CoA dehydrogenase [Desulfatirhabdiaceae bacterium]
MNFDFSEPEQIFLKNLTDMTQAWRQTMDFEALDPTRAEAQIRLVLSCLGRTPYLKTGGKDIGPSVRISGMEILAAHSPSLYLSIEMGVRLFGMMITEWETPEQKAARFSSIINGQMIGAVALSESAMNVDNEPLKTTGTIQGDDVVITGSKSFVVNAPIADWFAVVGRMGDGHAVFLVQKESLGLTIGNRLQTLGFNAAAISGIELADCRIPLSQVIGPIDSRNMLNHIRLWENQSLLGCCLGLMKAAYEEAKYHAKTHKSGGRPVIAYQEVGFKLSEMLTLLQTSQLLAARTAWTMETNRSEAESLMWCAKVFCAEAAEKVTGNALQILSGTGYVSGNASERAYRCAKFCQIAGTSTEISRVKIGDTALGYL